MLISYFLGMVTVTLLFAVSLIFESIWGRIAIGIAIGLILGAIIIIIKRQEG